jgi:hypothetical protein
VTGKRGTPRKPPATKAPAKPKAAPKKPASKASTGKPATGAVLLGVNREIAKLKKLDKDLATGALAATAQALARDIDSADTSPTSKATCARALADTLTALRDMAPQARAQDGVDELRDRRAARRAGSAGT